MGEASSLIGTVGAPAGNCLFLSALLSCERGGKVYIGPNTSPYLSPIFVDFASVFCSLQMLSQPGEMEKNRIVFGARKRKAVYSFSSHLPLLLPPPVSLPFWKGEELRDWNLGANTENGTKLEPCPDTQDLNWPE